jgi:single-strand DNA-binding protein
MYINKVILYGNLTRDPELKALPTGANVCNFSIATNRTFKDKNGVKQDQTEYHNIVAFGRTADLIKQYVKKGSPLYVEGRLQTRSWDKEGVKQYRTEILLEQMQFGPKGSGATGGSPSSSAPSSSKSSAPIEQPPMDTIEYPEESINVEDIPF